MTETFEQTSNLSKKEISLTSNSNSSKFLGRKNQNLIKNFTQLSNKEIATRLFKSNIKNKNNLIGENYEEFLQNQ